MSRQPAASNQVTDLLLRFIEATEGAGAVPALVCGDFNCTPQEIEGTTWMEAAGWRDILQEPTCLTARTNNPKRIDWLYMNRWSQRLRQGKPGLSWATGITTHACQWASLHVGQPRQHHRWEGPPHPPAVTADKEACAHYAAVCAASCKTEWDKAII